MTPRLQDQFGRKITHLPETVNQAADELETLLSMARGEN